MQVTYDFTNTSQTAGSGLHHHLAFPLAECVRETGLEVFVQNIVEVWLSSELVYPLRNLVPSRVAETREKREDFAPERCRGMFAEDNGGHCGHRELWKGYRALVELNKWLIEYLYLGLVGH